MLRTILLAVLTMTATSVHAADVGTRLQRFVDDVTTLSARFEQTQLDEDGEIVATRGGTFELARPGRFRWHYDTPYEQLMICDGRQIWNYEPDLSQVTVRDAGQILRDTPVALLAEGRNLGERFSIRDAGTDDDVQKLVLEPKADDADFRSVELWLQPSGVPVRMQLHDPLGGISDIRFSDVQRNAKPAAEAFQFTPPEGVEVVRLDGGPP